MAERPLHQLPELKAIHYDVRSEAAGSVWHAKNEYQEEKAVLSEGSAAIAGLVNEREALGGRQATLQGMLANGSLLERLTKRKERREIREESLSLEEEIGSLAVQESILRRELIDAEEKLEYMPKPQDVLQSYHEKLAAEQLTNAEKRQLLTPDFLASLSTEQYIELWRKLTPLYVSHITRHGVRQHTGSFHSGGVGKLSSGATGMLADGKLRSRHALHGLYGNDPEALNEYMKEQGFFGYEDAPRALRAFEEELHSQVAAAEPYPDGGSVHFATGKVLDEMYGGERDNQVFALYPADVIASQYAFSFNDGNTTSFGAHKSDEWNDLFVYPHGAADPGIALDAGLVFMPKSTMVDRETGSQFQVAEREFDYGWTVDSSMMPVIDSALVSRFRAFLDDLSDTEKGSNEKKSLNEYRAAFSAGLEKIGMDQESVKSLSNEAYLFIGVDGRIDTAAFNAVMKEILYGQPYFWKKAEDAVPAEQYWEEYFATHPEERPKHVLYYDGDPNQAVEYFLAKNNITNETSPDMQRPYLGYEDHAVIDTKNDRRAYPGYEEAIATAKAAIDSYFAERAVHPKE